MLPLSVKKFQSWKNADVCSLFKENILYDHDRNLRNSFYWKILWSSSHQSQSKLFNTKRFSNNYAQNDKAYT